MKIIKAGTLPSAKGPGDYFSGTVRIDSFFQTEVPSRVSMAIPTFEPGARTAWHTHPLGQTLVVLSGAGWIQIWGEEKKETFPGDIVYFADGENHWHGTTATTALSHIAIQESIEGKAVDWMEHTTEEQYRG